MSARQGARLKLFREQGSPVDKTVCATMDTKLLMIGKTDAHTSRLTMHYLRFWVDRRTAAHRGAGRRVCL